MCSKNLKKVNGGKLQPTYTNILLGYAYLEWLHGAKIVQGCGHKVQGTAGLMFTTVR